MDDRVYPVAAYFYIRNIGDTGGKEIAAEFENARLLRKTYDDHKKNVTIKPLSADEGLLTEMREMLRADRIAAFSAIPDEKRTALGYYDEGMRIECEAVFADGKSFGETLTRIFKDDPFNEAYELISSRF